MEIQNVKTAEIIDDEDFAKIAFVENLDEESRNEVLHGYIDMNAGFATFLLEKNNTREFAKLLIQFEKHMNSIPQYVKDEYTAHVARENEECDILMQKIEEQAEELNLMHREHRNSINEIKKMREEMSKKRK